MQTKNQKSFQLVFEVAKWEFKRWFKIKDQLIAILIALLSSFLFFGGQTLFKKFADNEKEIAVINNSGIQLKLDKVNNLKISVKENHQMDSLKHKLLEKNIEGILIINDFDNVELIANKEPSWLKKLKEALTLERQQIKIKESNISPEQLKEIFSQIDIKVNYTIPPKVKSTLGEKIAAGIFIGFMFFGNFIGLALLFTAITGEKQTRITEVIVAAISAQTWMDGKILGISFFSLWGLMLNSFSVVLFLAVSGLLGSGWSIPIVITNPILIFYLFIFSLAGFFFWNIFFSAIAATISDPNSSARGVFMFLPAAPAAIAFLGFGNPDSMAMKILTFFPPTSVPVISVRMVLSDVNALEIVISFLLLIVSTWYLRKIAGRIFAISMLMYGKEPAWREILKWFKASSN